MRLVGVVLTVLFFLSPHVYSKIKRDTIYTIDRDRIILTYEITNVANSVTIRFIEQQKKLGEKNKTDYKDLKKVAVMFFDRTGNYSSEVSISDMEPEAFMIPSDVRYQESQDGFYLVQAGPELSFTVKTDAEIQIPIYLAYKPKKGKYKLFSKSMDLRIPLEVQKSLSPTRAAVQSVQQTITSTTEIESDNRVEIKILESIRIAENLISEATELPFSEELSEEIRFLRSERREVTDATLVLKINGVIEQYESKRQLLEEKSLTEQQARQKEEELRARKEAQLIKAQNDSIAAAQQIAVEKEKKRNLWMVVGGIVFAVLAFIGNQVFQSIRNKRNQMQMMDMQQNIADRAEIEAKRRARNAIRNQRNRIMNNTKRKTSRIIRDKVTINVNGKSKKASI